jgi:hypothetical protein
MLLKLPRLQLARMNGLIPTTGRAVFHNISRLESRHQIGESHHDGMSRSVTNELSAVLQYLEELSDSCVYWLVVSAVSTPLKNMKVSWDYYSQYMEK